MHLGDDFTFTGSGSIGTFILDGDYDTTVPSTRTFSGLTLGSYTVTEAAATGFTLTNLVCTSTEGTADTTVTNLSTRTATIDLDGGETVTCTFTNSIDSCTPPAVTTQPVSQAITYGSNVSFTVAGTNYTSIQWQVNSGSGWSNISGATSATYTLTKPAVSLSGSQYRAILTGDCTPAATSTEATLTVNKAPVTATAGTYSSTYDGAAHSPSACAVTGTYTGDLSCINSPSSVGPGVGAGTITPVVNGTGLDNYAITSVNGTWSITPATLTASITAENKTYDSTANATVTGCMLTGVVSGENVTCDYASVIASFADKNVGVDKLVSATGLTLSGTDTSNYSFIGTGSGTASITAIHITGNFTAEDKVYDGITAATVSSSDLSGVVSGDDVSLVGGTATFSDKNVGMDKAVTLTGVILSGTDAGNYILDSVTPTTADIQAAILTANVTANNKVYDGLTDAIVTSCSLNDLASGDYVFCIFSSTYTANFNDKNVGMDKTVTITGVGLSGTDAGNYILDPVVTTTADITQLLVNVNPVSGQFKIYGDGEPTLSYTVEEPGLATGDSFTGTLSRYLGEDVGFYDITLGTMSINDGNGGANYNLGLGVEVQFEIKPKHITGSFTAKDKEYDGTTAAAVILRELSDVLNEDAVSLSGGTATFSDKNVGMDKEVTLTGAILSGTDAGNYVLDSVATTTADINQRFIIVRPVSGQFKIYGDEEPILTYTVDEPGLAAGDSFTGVLSRYSGEGVGFYEIRLGTLAINDGNGGNNYRLGFGIEVEFEIKPKHITGSFTAKDKVYDGTTVATVTFRDLSDVLSEDDVNLTGGTAAFSDKNVGTGKTVTLTGASLTGTDAGNYILDSITPTTADIKVRDIGVQPVSGQFKVYGDTDPALTFTVEELGLAAGDSFTGVLSRYSGEGVGFYEIRLGTLAINDGNGGNNYRLWFGIEVEFEIKPKHITGSFTAKDKVYDSTTAAAVNSRSLIGAVSGDDVSLVGGIATFSDKNVGTGKIVTLTGASLGGTEAGNYVLDSVENATATITKADPICNIEGYTGIYDGLAHGASGSCTGVQDETLAGLDLGGSFTNVPGGTAYWTFIDETGNYNNDNGNVNIVVMKADPICSINGYSDVYDGNSHGASGSCTGVKGEVLTTLDLGESFTNVPGGTAYWTFNDESGNYEDDSGSVEIVISKADPTCNIDGFIGVYDGNPHGSTGTCTGVKEEVLSTLNLGDSFTNVPGGTANWTFTDSTGNYNDDAGSVKIVILKAVLTITADNQAAQYSDETPQLTFIYSGFIGNDDPDDLATKPSCSTTRLISSPAGEYPITCSGGEDDNYSFNYVDGNFTVTKENAIVTFDDGNPAALQVSAPEGPLNANELTLVIKVKEKLPDLATSTAIAGNINNAGLIVKLEPLSGGAAITLDCSMAVEGTGYDGVKTFTCTNSQPLAVDTYDVVALVDGNYYIGEGYDGFTVYDPSLGYTTGGGWFYWPGTTEKTNFGFTMKYNKKATNIQGNLLVIRHHADGTISRLKSNALDGLALKDIDGCGIATFSGKSTYETWDPEANEGLGGYVTLGGIRFSVYVEDCNEPGTGVDKFWVRSMDKLVLEKPAPTNAVTIGGGNIVVPHTPNNFYLEPIDPKKFK